MHKLKVNIRITTRQINQYNRLNYCGKVNQGIMINCGVMISQGIKSSDFHRVHYPKVSAPSNIPRYLLCIFFLVLTCIFALHLSYQYPYPRHVLTMNVPCSKSCNGPCQPNIAYIGYSNHMFLSMYISSVLCRTSYGLPHVVLSLKSFGLSPLFQLGSSI